jgi:hypothetical protein
VAGAFLVGYIAWSLGGGTWLLAPLVVFLSYTLLSPWVPANRRRIHNIHAVVAVASGGVVWLLLYSILNWPELLLPYTLSYAAQLAIIGYIRLRRYPRRLPEALLLTVCVLKGWACLFVPYLLAGGPPYGLAVGLAGVAAAALAFAWLQPGLDDCPADTPRWLRQAVCGGAASVLGLVGMMTM